MGRNSSGVNGSRGGVTKAEWDSVETYVSGDGMWVNNYWRGEDVGELSSSDKKMLSNIEKATNNRLGSDMELHRSVDAQAIFGSMSDMQYESLVDALGYGDTNRNSVAAKQRAMSVIGKTITEKGVMSTSKSSSVAENWGDFSGSSKPVVLNLKTPKGARGLDVSRFDIKGDKQREVILGRNTKYRINKVYYKNGNVHVDADVLK
jgi:hypothetical protein